TLGDRLRPCFDDWRDEHNTLWLKLEPAADTPHEKFSQRQRLERLLQRLAAEGIVAFHLPRAALSNEAWRRVLGAAPCGAVLCREPSLDSLKKSLEGLPSLIMVPDDLPADDLRRLLRLLGSDGHIPRLAFVPASLRDPDRS